MERVTGNERKGRSGCGIKNSGIVRRDDPHPIDLVTRHARCGLNLYLVVGANVFEWPKERVAVAGDSTVTRLPGKSRPFDVSCTEP